VRLKVAIGYGIDFNVKLNLQFGGGLAPPPARYGPIDNLAVKPIIIPRL